MVFRPRHINVVREACQPMSSRLTETNSEKLQRKFFTRINRGVALLAIGVDHMGYAKGHRATSERNGRNR